MTHVDSPLVGNLPWAGISDPVSSLTHLCGALAFAAFAVELLRLGGGNRLRQCALGTYVAGVVGTLLASGVLHVVDPASELRGTLARVDHAAIFALIAGTYTPVHVIQFKGGLRWGVLGVVWGAALTGMIFKVVFFAHIPEWVGLSLYLGLGWAGLISAAALYQIAGLRPLVPLVVGAVFYTVGAALDFIDAPVLISGVLGPHETFHMLVLVGIASHWLYIRRIVVAGRIGTIHSAGATWLTGEPLEPRRVYPIGSLHAGVGRTRPGARRL